jgi:hypothetical protein
MTIIPESRAATAERHGVPLVDDRFETGRPLGRVVDTEGVISVDHGALRIGTMAVPGWGRTGVSYGPYAPLPGRAFSVHLLNGHNTSEPYVLEAVYRRVGRWWKGSGTDGSLVRAWRYRGHLAREPLRRKVRYWWQNRGRRGGTLSEMRENLAVGWFDEARPTSAARAAGAVVVRATGPRNGELTVSGPAGLVSLFDGLQNLPTFYVSILRERGAILYGASSQPGANGLPTYPWLRPLAIDPRPAPGPLHAGIHQLTTGQIGFSCDTRVYTATAVDVPALAQWCTSAAVADRLGGHGPLAGSGPERGGRWQGERDGLLRAGDGAVPGPSAGELCWVEGDTAFGLIHLLVERGEGPASVHLAWGGAEATTGLVLELSDAGARLSRGGTADRTSEPGLEVGTNVVQVVDSGDIVVVTLNGAPLFDGACSRPEGGRDRGRLGLGGRGAVTLRDLEAHPRRVTVPAELAQPAVHLEIGDRLDGEDTFPEAADDLDHRAGPGGRTWRRVMGTGTIEVPEPGRARYRASVTEPIPDRTAYLLDWDDPSFADIEVEVVAPGSAAGGGERCRAGLVMWQDELNHFAVNAYLDDAYPGASTSTFFYFRGFEDIYDAVWSNVGTGITWKRPFRLRLVSDGLRYLVLLDDEPVLYRAFADVYPRFDRLQIRQVGLIANWEWGHDTGSELRRVVTRTRTAASR